MSFFLTKTRADTEDQTDGRNIYEVYLYYIQMKVQNSYY